MNGVELLILLFSCIGISLGAGLAEFTWQRRTYARSSLLYSALIFVVTFVSWLCLVYDSGVIANVGHFFFGLVQAPTPIGSAASSLVGKLHIYGGIWSVLFFYLLYYALNSLVWGFLTIAIVRAVRNTGLLSIFSSVDRRLGLTGLRWGLVVIATFTTYVALVSITSLTPFDSTVAIRVLGVLGTWLCAMIVAAVVAPSHRLWASIFVALVWLMTEIGSFENSASGILSIGLYLATVSAGLLIVRALVGRRPASC